MLRNYTLQLGLLIVAVAVAPSCGSTTSPTGANTGGNNDTAGLADSTAGTPSGGAADGGAANVSGTGGAPSGAAGAADSVAGSSADGGLNSGAGSAGTAGGSAWTFPPGVTKPRIMIVGDSISAGPGCYKKYLLKQLTDNHYSNFEFVGQYSDDCGGLVRHSAVSCSTAEQFTRPTFMMPNCAQAMTFPGMSTLVTTHHPDLVMIQLGVNDVWNSRATNDILASYALLVQQARTQNPAVAIAVARIQKIRPNCTDDAVTLRAEALVNAVPAWAAGLSTPQSPLFVADLWTNSDWSMAETLDCIHPNDVGAQRMGLNWYNTLKNVLHPD